MELEQIIAEILLIFLFLGMVPFTLSYLYALDTSAWTFTGHVFAAQILQLVPYIMATVAIGIAAHLAIKRVGE